VNKLLTSLFVALLIVTSAFSADVYNAGTVTKQESATQVTYTWVVTFNDVTTDSTDNVHSPAIFIADCNDVDGVWFSKSANSAVDADGFLHFSSDNSNWVIGTTDADLNDAFNTTTGETDTVGIAEGANQLFFHQSHQMVIELDGQNTNDLENEYEITVIVSFTKDGEYELNPELQVGRTFRSRGTP
jgi:hypothetical protein